MHTNIFILIFFLHNKNKQLSQFIFNSRAFNLFTLKTIMIDKFSNVIQNKKDKKRQKKEIFKQMKISK